VCHFQHATCKASRSSAEKNEKRKKEERRKKKNENYVIAVMFNVCVAYVSFIIYKFSDPGCLGYP